MAYLAIARKYRPNSFEEMVGQNHVTATLRNAILRQRIHHAYLFCGARGVGKTTAARAFARALSCAQGPTPEPCGECPSCKAILAGSSPDLTEIDGASNNSVDDILGPVCADYWSYFAVSRFVVTRCFTGSLSGIGR